MVEWEINPKLFVMRIKYWVKNIDIERIIRKNPIYQIEKKKKSIVFKGPIWESPILEICFEDKESCNLFYVWIKGQKYENMVKILRKMIIKYFEEKYIKPLKKVI